jgi:hypothetical protein
MIDFCSLFGWTYDKKIASPEMIEARVRRTGEKNDHRLPFFSPEVMLKKYI